MIPEELIHGIEGGVDTGRAHETGTVMIWFMIWCLLGMQKKGYQYYELGNTYKFKA